MEKFYAKVSVKIILNLYNLSNIVLVVINMLGYKYTINGELHSYIVYSCSLELNIFPGCRLSVASF